MSIPFIFNFDVVSAEQNLDFQTVLGKAARASIQGIGGTRHVHGIVRRIEETSRSPERSRYTVVVVPDVWRLSLRQTSRIFQQKSVPTVVTEVLEKAQVPSDRGDHGHRCQSPRLGILRPVPRVRSRLHLAASRAGRYFLFFPTRRREGPAADG